MPSTVLSPLRPPEGTVIASAVKKAKDETEWLAFAKTHKPGELKAEVKHALETGRSTPRKGRYGLPNIRQTLKFNLTREEYEMVRKALQKMAAHLWEADCAEGKGAEGKGAEGAHEEGQECEAKGRSRTADEVLVELAKKVLEADLPGFLSMGKNRSIYNLVYETCIKCKAGHLRTDDDGPVEVTRERIEEVAKVAEIVEIGDDELIPVEALSPGQVEEEIPKEVLAKALALSNHACARCGRKVDLHAHHLIFRSRGGPNATWNIAIVCSVCHSLVHAGDLDAYRDSKGKLQFKPRSERLTALLADEVKELAAIPQVQVVVVVPAEEEVSPPPAPPPAAPAVPDVPTAVKQEAVNVTRALRQAGYGAEDARGRTARALALLSNLGRAPTGDEIFNTALRGVAVVYGPGPDSAKPENGTGRNGKSCDGARKSGSKESGGAEGGARNGEAAV